MNVFCLRIQSAAFLFWMILAPAFAQAVNIPDYWEPHRRTGRSVTVNPGVVRVLTAPDYPPFNFLNTAGDLTGFNIELARAACLELQLTCTIQARAFNGLTEALREKQADIVIAGLAPSSDLRKKFEVGDIYLQNPARFAVRRDSPLLSTEPEQLKGKRIGALSESAHMAFLQTFYPQVSLRLFNDMDSARAALRSGETDALFADAVSLAFWMNGTSSEDCCMLLNGAYTENHFFGDGYAMVFRPGATSLQRAFDGALQRLSEKGVYAEIYLRWFPIGLY